MASCCDDVSVTLFRLNSVSAVMGRTGFVRGYTIGAAGLLQKSMSTATSTAASSMTTTPSAVSSAATGPQYVRASSVTTNAEAAQSGSLTRGSDATNLGVGAGLGVGLPLLAGLAVAFMRSQSKDQRKDSEVKTAIDITYCNRMVYQELGV